MRFLANVLLISFLFCCLIPSTAGDLIFDSFEEAKAAADRRSDEYDRRMQEHMDQVMRDWERQQADLAESGAIPDITDITSRSDTGRTSDSSSADRMQDRVTGSVNDLQELLSRTAGANCLGFAGGGAGYQWSVVVRGDKFVLQDSYDEAAFHTGDRREQGEREASGEGSAEVDVAATADPDPEPEPAPVRPEPSPQDRAADPSPASPGQPGQPAQPSTGQAPGTSADPSPGEGEAPEIAQTPDQQTPDQEEPPAEGVDIAPPELPPPPVRLVVEHPIEYTEEHFTSGVDEDLPAEYFRLERFTIPEDTRVRINVEVAPDIDRETISMRIVDAEGESAPIRGSALNNYRHMFRIPSDDRYSARLYMSNAGHDKKIMQVALPVTPMDFERRTVDGRHSASAGGATSSSHQSSAAVGSTRTGTSRGGVGEQQQVSLTDLYSRPSIGQSSTQHASTAGAGSSHASHQGTHSAHSAGSAHSSANNHGTSHQAATSSNHAQASHQHDQTSHIDTAHASLPSSQNVARGGHGQGARHQHSDSAASSRHADSSDSYSASTDSRMAFADTSSQRGSSATSRADAGYAQSSAAQQRQRYYSDRGYDYNPSTGEITDSRGNTVSQEEAGYPDYDHQEGYQLDDYYDDGQEDDDDFILAVAIRSSEANIYQSFDFISVPRPSTTIIPAGTDLAFDFILSEKVNPESIRVQLSNGQGQTTNSLSSLGTSFVQDFPRPTNSAYLRIRGSSNDGPFEYNLRIPVQ